MMMIVVEDRRGFVFVSMVVSVLLHVVGAMALFWAGYLGGGTAPVMSDERLTLPEEREDELRLGLDEAESASIDWLGIKEPEPVVGEAVISETDQAAQALVVGEEVEVLVEDVPVEQAEEMAEEMVEEVVAEVVEPMDEVADVAEALVVEEGEGVVVVAQAEEVVEANEAEPVQEVESVEPVEPVEEVKELVVSSPRAVPAGTRGVLSKREVVATRIKRAIEVDPHTPNAPIVGKGMEILTVRPRYTAAVRLSAVPKNPIVVMWFDGKGKVSKAEFLRDGKKVYSSGVVGVDQPLLNAMYQWRAKGKEIEALDADDPESLVEVSIKIVFRKERKGRSD